MAEIKKPGSESEYRKLAAIGLQQPTTPDKMDSHDKMKTRKPEQDSEHMNKSPEELQKRQAEFAKRKAQKDMERKKRGLKIGPNIYGGGLNPAASTTTATGTKVSNV